VCDDIEMGVLGAMVKTKLSGAFNTLVIRATGELLDDIAAATGATPVSPQTGVSLENVDITKHLGRAKSVISDQKKTQFVATAKTAEAQAKQLTQQANNTKNEIEQKALKKRASKLRGGVALLKVGTTSEADRGYLKDKAEDAVAAVKAALAEGHVEGGGMTLYRIAEVMKPKTIGEEILKRVLTSPLRMIIENGGEDYATIVKNLPATKGYNAKTGEYADLIKEGIIDPAKVERVAVESAVSAVSTLITTHAAITDHVETKD
jgi:chaperonin GroEL